MSQHKKTSEPKKIAHGYSVQHNKERMAKYDPENAQAWAAIMKKVREEYASGSTQLAIAKKIGVTKVAVSRWLSQDRGGERTTFGDMIRYARALGIPFNDLVGIDKATQEPVTDYYKKLGKILAEFARDDEMSVDDLADKSQIPASEISAIFEGNKAITVRQLHMICKALEVKSHIILNRTMQEHENEKTDETR